MTYTKQQIRAAILRAADRVDGVVLTKTEAGANIVAKMELGDRRDADLMRHRELAKAAEREWALERAASEQMRRAEGAWEDAGCPR